MCAMKLPNIAHSVRSSFTYATDYFKQSSWEGKTVRVLCGLSIIIFVISLLRRFSKPNDSGGGSNNVRVGAPPSIVEQSGLSNTSSSSSNPAERSTPLLVAEEPDFQQAVGPPSSGTV